MDRRNFLELGSAALIGIAPPRFATGIFPGVAESRLSGLEFSTSEVWHPLGSHSVTSNAQATVEVSGPLVVQIDSIFKLRINLRYARAMISKAHLAAEEQEAGWQQNSRRYRLDGAREYAWVVLGLSDLPYPIQLGQTALDGFDRTMHRLLTSPCLGQTQFDAKPVLSYRADPDAMGGEALLECVQNSDESPWPYVRAIQHLESVQQSLNLEASAWAGEIEKVLEQHR